MGWGWFVGRWIFFLEMIVLQLHAHPNTSFLLIELVSFYHVCKLAFLVFGFGVCAYLPLCARTFGSHNNATAHRCEELLNLCMVYTMLHAQRIVTHGRSY